jgi:hypothetical protein
MVYRELKMVELEKFIEEYFKIENIPLKNHLGKSTVKMVVYGRTRAGWGPGAYKWQNNWFPDKPKNQYLYTYILNLFDLKFCFKCEQILEQYDFYKGQTKCKSCSKNTANKWHSQNKEKGAASSAKRRAAILKRTPSWADQEAINFFYECCPKDCHVDHIIPLQGKKVSGLHVETNLQWLPAKNNLSKGNKWNG